MSLHPLDPEVFTRIKADHRSRRGPFRHAVVMAHELVAHYGVRSIKRTQAAWALRQIGTREKLSLVTPRTRLFVVDPSLVDLKPAEVLAEYRRERGLPAGTSS